MIRNTSSNDTPSPLRGAARRRSAGFTLVELIIAILVVSILTGLAIPSYLAMAKRSSRDAAKAQLMELAGLQERIFLNSNGYTAKVTTAYDGTSGGGLGITSGTTADGKYQLTSTVSDMFFSLKATPVSGSSQAGDGILIVNARGERTWKGTPW